MIRYDIK